MAMYPEYNKEERRRHLNREAQKRSESKHQDEVRQRKREVKKRLWAKTLCSTGGNMLKILDYLDRQR